MNDRLAHSLQSQIASRLNKLTVGALFALVVFFSFQQVYSPDIGFHLKGGDWILEHLRFPGNDPFTYTASTHEYIDLHWIYQILVSLSDKVAGEFGLVAFNTVCLLLSFLVLLYRCLRKAPLSRTASWQLLFFLAIWAVSFQFEVRPQSLSWVYLNLLLFILEDYYDNGKSKYLLFVPLIMLLWTNSHSIFVMGWLVIGCYAVGVSVREKKVWTPVVPVAIASFAVSFLNPYFARGVALPFQQFAFLQSGNVFKESIAEYASPMSLESYVANGSFTLLQPLLPFHLFFIIALIAFVFRLKKIAFHELLLFLFFGYLAVKGIRNIGNFVVVVFPATLFWLQRPVPAADETAESAGVIRRLSNVWNGPRVQTAWNVLTIAVSVILILAVTNGSYYIGFRSNNRFGFSYNRLTLPVEAASFLVDKKLGGRILNDFSFGGFFIKAIPQKVFMDGRNEVIGESLYIEYSRLWGSVDKQPLLDKYRPEIVVFPYQQEFLWVHFFKGDSSWRLVHIDPVAALYVRRGISDELPEIDSLFYSRMYDRIGDSQIDSLLSQDPPRSTSLLSIHAQYFPLRELDLSTFCYYNDWYDAAIQIGLNGLKRSTVDCPEMYYNLGHFFYEKQDFRRSALCYQRFLKTNSDGLAAARVSSILLGQAQNKN